jgi:beta-glucosidase
MDNYEWFRGYEGCFGLLAVDRVTQRRSIRPSAALLGTIARINAVTGGRR